MKIDFFLRNPGSGYSIARVVKPYVEFIGKEHDVKLFVMPFPGANPRSVLKNLIFVRRCRRPGAVYHITGENHYLAYVLPPEKTVVTVHDIAGVYVFRNYFWDYHYYRGLFVRPLRKPALVVCVSEFTRSEVVRHARVAAEKLCVIPNPVPDGFVPSPKKFNDNIPTVLFIGNTENKNLVNLVRAMAGLPLRLRIVASPGERELRLLADSGVAYSVVSRLSDQEMLEEYRNADIVSAVSRFEGFGMPILEGQAIGRSVLTSTLEPMASVAGEGALKVDPYDPAAIRNGLERLLREPDLRRDLIGKGLENARRHTPEKIAAAYLKLYREL